MSSSICFTSMAWNELKISLTFHDFHNGWCAHLYERSLKWLPSHSWTTAQWICDKLNNTWQNYIAIGLIETLNFVIKSSPNQIFQSKVLMKLHPELLIDLDTIHSMQCNYNASRISIWQIEVSFMEMCLHHKLYLFQFIPAEPTHMKYT